jgi:hypothetical protein
MRAEAFPTNLPPDLAGCLALQRAVPVGARRILLAGDGLDLLARGLRDARRDRRSGEPPQGTVGPAVDELHECGAGEVPPLPAGSLDGIVVSPTALEGPADPATWLGRLRPLLAPGGEMVCGVPNQQHHARIRALLRGDMAPPAANGPPRAFTFASFVKLALDAGFAPALVDGVRVPLPEHFLVEADPLLAAAGADRDRSRVYMELATLVFRCTPLCWEEDAAWEPLTFVACVSDEEVLAANLLASPDLRGATPHELIEVRGATSAGEGINAGIEQAHHRHVVLVHQDVYLPRGWSARFHSQLRAAGRHGPVGVAGVYGARHAPKVPGATLRVGHVVDRHVLRREPGELPAPVETLDELLLAVPRASSRRLDPALGWHFYGADLACAARRDGAMAVVLDAPCFHNSVTGAALPPAFHESAGRFREKWRHALPIATPCTVVA